MFPDRHTGTPSELSYSTVTPRARSESFSTISEETTMESFDPVLTRSGTDEASFNQMNPLRPFSYLSDDLEKGIQPLNPLLCTPRAFLSSLLAFLTNDS